MTLTDLTRSEAKIHEIARHLDALDPATRVAELHALPRNEQARLYEKAADAPPLDLAFFVPADVPDLSEVIHFGRNSQPLFRDFQKRWCRPSGHDGQLWGYNETSVRGVIGPGYFVAHETEGGGADPRGAIVVDYFMVPDGPVVPGWPEVRPNRVGLQRFVYDKTRDYMRRVSQHCSIGVAHRLESRVMGYFVLCREAAGAESHA